MSEIKQRMLTLLSLIARLNKNPDQQEIAHSLMIHYMAFISFVESSEYYNIVSSRDKMTRNDIAHTSVVPIANGLLIKKIMESVEQLKNNVIAAGK